MTLWLTEGKSWYKNGQTGAAKVRTLWPGSSQHAFVALRHPRWEDFELRRADADGYTHTMAWLGNGHIADDVDAAFYYPELRKYHGVSRPRHTHTGARGLDWGVPLTLSGCQDPSHLVQPVCDLLREIHDVRNAAVGQRYTELYVKSCNVSLSTTRVASESGQRCPYSRRARSR